MEQCNSKNKFLIIYHKEDNDGVFSAALAYVYLTKTLNYKKEQIFFEGTTYSKLAEKYPDKDSLTKLFDVYTNIIMTDISFNDYKQMINLKEHYNESFSWIDHHKPIIDMSILKKFDSINGWRDTSRAAILNMYRYLFDPLDEKYQNHIEPTILRILSAYDTWTYEREGYSFEYCRDVNKGITVTFDLELDKIIDYVETLFDSENNSKNNTKFINEMLNLGNSINKYDDMLYKSQVLNYGDFDWKVNGNKAVMIMLQGPTSTNVFKILQNTDYKNGIVLKYFPSNKWTLSLYNINHSFDNEFNCGKYLQNKYKGGGHAGAAGATLDEKQMKKIFKNKEI